MRPLADESYRYRYSSCPCVSEFARAREAKRQPISFRFMFQLSSKEMQFLSPDWNSKRMQGGRRYAPYAFTEHGIAMLSSVLRARAVQSERRGHAKLCPASRNAHDSPRVAPKN